MLRHPRNAVIVATLCGLFAGRGWAESGDFKDVIAAATLDFAGTGQQDRAVLVQSQSDTADLYLYMPSEATEPSSLKLVEVVRGVVSSGRSWGQIASLAVSARGTLLVKSGNESVGRDRWTQTLTVVYRNKNFVIGGITRTSRDTLDPNSSGKCDLNLLTGKGTRNGSPVAGKLAPLRLADWSDDKLPQECQF